jgi:hypothetical protein
MALRFIDGFDHYAIGDITKKWTSTVATATSIVAGRTGNCFRITNSSSVGSSLIKTIDAQATWVVGFGMKIDNALITTEFFQVYDGSTKHLYLQVEATNRLSIYHGNGSLIATSTNTVPTGAWFYVEFKFTIADSTSGAYELRVNGSSTGWIPAANGDTRNAGNATADNFRFVVGNWNGQVISIDDLYIADGQTGINDFLGDVKVETLLPNANGTNSQFVGQDGNSTDNYLNVDEASMDSDTTYNYDSTVGHRDTYNYPSTTLTSIDAVQVNGAIRKDDAGERTVSLTCISGATTDDAAAVSPGVGYANYMKIYENDPNGSIEWTPTNLNACEFGILVVS